MPEDTEEGFFDYLRTLDSSKIRVTGMKEGSIVFASEPLLIIEGPILLIQLIETPLLNFVNFPTLICTNASRMVTRAGPNVSCVEFGLR